MWELYCKEGWVPKNWCFQIVVLENTLESPLGCKEIEPVNLIGNKPLYPLEGLMLKMNFQCFGHLMQRANSLEKILMLGKIEGKRRMGDRESGGRMVSLTHMSLSILREIVEYRRGCHAAIHGATESRTRLSDRTSTTLNCRDVNVSS